MRLNNGLDIPQLGVGTWTLRGETAQENMRLALEAGFRHIHPLAGEGLYKTYMVGNGGLCTSG